MESFLRTRVDLQQMMYSSSTMALGGGGDAHYFEDLVTPEKVRQYLNSSSESDKLKGMKVLLAQLSKGKDIPEYFPDVVKNVVVKSVEVKKMIYMYMVHYADFDRTCREIALLSINTFHRDMSDPNPFVRGMALRVLTSIRVDDVIQIQLHAIRSCAVDSSPYVRKCAANAIPKMFYLDPTKLDNLKGLLETLLKDNSTMVLGSTLAAFNEVCPSAFELLHAHFRKICYLLADMDEWSQVPILEVLARYVRHHFTDPAPEVAATMRLQAKQRSTAAISGGSSRLGEVAAVSSPRSAAATRPNVKPKKAREAKKKKKKKKNAFYSDDEDQSDEEEEEEQEESSGPVPKPQLGSTNAGDDEVDLDPDHRLVLKSALPLLKSRNAAVVIAVAALHYYCGSQGAQVMQQVAKAMVRILRTRREVQFVVLHCVRSMARERPDIFRAFLPDFVVKSTDPLFNKLLKVDILSALASADNVPRVLKEYQLYAADQNETLVAHTVSAVGQVADADPTVAGSSMEGIMRILMRSSASGVVVSACTVALRQLLQQNMHSQKSCANVVKQLMKLLITENDDGVSEPSARSSIVWLAGEFHSLLGEATPDILRVLAMGFAEESADTRMQVLNLAIKLSLLLPDDEKVQLLATYVLEMARYDPDTDVRDRSRLMTALMGLAPSTADADGNDVSTVDEDALAVFSEHAANIMLARKLPPITAASFSSSSSFDPDGSSSDFYVGSLSSVVNHNAVAYIHIAPWAEAVVPSVRDGVDGAIGADFLPGHGHHHHPTQSSGGTGGSDDDFYDGEEESSKGSRSDSSSSDDSSQGSDSSYDTSSSNSDSSSSSGDDDDDDDEDSSSSSEDEDSSVDRSVPGPGARKTPSRPVGPGSIQSHSSGAVSSGGSSSSSVNNNNNYSNNNNNNNNNNNKRSTQVTSTSSSTNMTGSRSVVSNAGMKKVVKSTVTVASSSSSSSGKVVSSSRGSIAAAAAVGPSFDLMNLEPLHVAPVGRLQIHSAADLIGSPLNAGVDAGADGDAPLDLLNGWSSGYSDPMAMNSMQAMSAMNSMQGKSLMNGMSSSPGFNAMSSSPAGMMAFDPVSPGAGMMAPPSLLSIGAPPHVQHPPPASTAGDSPLLPVTDSMSAPKLVLRPEVGGGLKVSLCFRRTSLHHHTAAAAASSSTTTASSVFQAVLSVTNCREYPIRRVRIVVQSTDPNRPSMVLPEVAVIPPASCSPSDTGDHPTPPSGMFRSSHAVTSAHEVSFPLDLVLPHCSVRQLKVDVRSESGAYVGCLSLEEWDLVWPLPMHVFAFEDCRARLGGFCENSRSYPLSAITAGLQLSTTGEVERQLQQRVQRALFVCAVQGLNKKELMFAGCLHKGSEVHRLLITVSLSSDSAKVRINCEDPVFSSRLSDVFVTLLLL